MDKNLHRFFILNLIILFLSGLLYPQDISYYLSEKQFKAGIIRFHNREYEAAVQLFNKALSIYPSNYRARYYLGLSYFQAGYLKNTIDEWENIINFGRGNYLLKQKLNYIYQGIAINKKYEYSTPYVFTSTLEGNLTPRIKRPSFIKYDEKSDSILVSSTKRKYVIEIDANGNIIREIGRQIGNLFNFEMPMGIEIYNDKIFISDFKKDYIFVFNREGKYLNEKIGGHGFGVSNLSGPMGIYIKDDYIFVVDNGNDRIQKFSITGEWIQSIGEGELKRPTDICGNDNLIYISDSMNSRVVVYDTYGNFVKTIGEGVLIQPRGLEMRENKLFISDSKEGLFVYDIEKDTFEKVEIGKEKLSLPFDVCADLRGILYETDFNTSRIFIFKPMELQYANLDVSISQIWLDAYPRNFIHIRVRDRLGNPIFNLKEENFLVYEEGTLSPIVKLGATYEFRKNMYIKFIIDKHISMKEYEADLLEFFGSFLEKMSGKDWIDIKVVSDDIMSSGKINASLLWPQNFYKEQKFTESYGKLDIAIHDSIRELLNINRNKAIVIFTSGSNGINNFPTYEPDILINYARNNAIPIYVINFSDNNRELFSMLAKETYGKYYTLKDFKNILNLHETIKNSPPLEYILSYDGLNLKGLKNFFVNVRVRVKYKELTGVDEIGYFVPEYFLPLRFFGGKSVIEF